MLPLLLALLALFPRPQLPDPEPPPAPLVLRVDLPDIAPTGMIIPFRVALANPGFSPVTVELSGRPTAFDLLVQTEAGELIWRRLEGVPVEAVLVSRELAPGEVLTFDARWDQRDRQGDPVAPGVYQVRAVLPVPAAAGGWGSPIRLLTITP